MTTEWFESWFDSKYYHLLYQDRDEKEAETFIKNLLEFLKPKNPSSFLDIGCGAGRHAIQVHKQGHEVVGLDLSENSIQVAKKHEETGLNFFVHDMRQKYRINYFDYVLNLFTSFGYFNSEREELNTLLANVSNLKKGGILVIDYLNTPKVIEDLVKEENKIVEDIEFKIKKTIENNQVVKSIQFDSKEGKQIHEERVKLLRLEDFQRYFQKVGLSLQTTFGNYQLEPYSSTSKRLIMIVKKE